MLCLAASLLLALLFVMFRKSRPADRRGEPAGLN
jgi:hypothetical protein